MNTGAVHTEGNVMERIESITYDTTAGPVMLAKVGADWIVSNLRTGSDDGFATIVGAMAHIKAAYGWPLSLVSEALNVTCVECERSDHGYGIAHTRTCALGRRS